MDTSGLYDHVPMSQIIRLEKEIISAARIRAKQEGTTLTRTQVRQIQHDSPYLILDAADGRTHAEIIRGVPWFPHEDRTSEKIWKTLVMFIEGRDSMHFPIPGDSRVVTETALTLPGRDDVEMLSAAVVAYATTAIYGFIDVGAVPGLRAVNSSDPHRALELQVKDGITRERVYGQQLVDALQATYLKSWKHARPPRTNNLYAWEVFFADTTEPEWYSDFVKLAIAL